MQKVLGDNMNDAKVETPDASALEVEVLKEDVPYSVKRTRKISDTIDYAVSLISGEWLLSSVGLSNGGSVIVLRALFVALWVLLLVMPASLAVKDLLDTTRGGTFDGNRLIQYMAHHLTAAAVVFGSVYTALYARFAAQWRYLADVYNKIKEAEVKYSTQPDAAERLAEWKAGFAEDAEELHLATKKIFAQVIRTWLVRPEVKNAFVRYTEGGESRYQKLMKNVLWAVHIDAENPYRRRRPSGD
ncbi:hypothetical protein [Burkholderia ubonensis]|uniref:hypothetical protein n=1 Tax=Burkholderia ubonensis TaxID=101571 RepID=UPI00075D402B|nr:hypothetical protein [Burkholderia ubonensis]KVC70838.1 hypothetical protein WI75_26230 [Burkholderia ubonensis]KVL63050.1 hypothetical protein WJ48_24045 [Burkholderia ubonensis]KVL76929.1 hypothetical protein WJ49_11295 [Burkholderia ubonensis]KVL91669.1 hypothetical protein WJ50_00480 [Burkholderia ubonensis]